MDIEISFCTLSFNHAKFIKQCIQSIHAQGLFSYEIIALDDGSKDESAKILQDLAKISPCPMRVISQKNSGKIGANCNKMASFARGKFLAFISCDDAFVANTFKEKLAFFEDENIALVLDKNINFINENNEPFENPPKYTLQSLENPSIKQILELNFSELHSFFIQGAIFRADIFKEISGFDEDMICDDIILRTKYLRYLLKNKNLKIKILEKPGVLYRQHENNIHKNALRQTQGVMEYLEKYWQDKEPPSVIYSWIEHCLNQTYISQKDKVLLFVKNEYFARILEHKNYINLILNDENERERESSSSEFLSSLLFINEKTKSANFALSSFLTYLSLDGTKPKFSPNFSTKELI